MSQKLYLCGICGKKFETRKGVDGHQRVHSSKRNRIENDYGLERICGFKKSRVCSVSSSRGKETEAFDLFGIGSCFSMSEIEKRDVTEAAVNLVMLSQRVYDFASIRNLPMDLEIKPLRSKLRRKIQSSYECDICGKSFGCFRALGGHKGVNRSIKGLLVGKNEYTEAKKIVLTQPSRFEVSQEKKNLQYVEPKLEFHELLAHSGLDKSRSKTRFSAFDSPPEARKIVSQPSSFGVSQEKILHCAESKLDFSELLSPPGFDRFNALHSPLRSKSHSSYRFKLCGKSFVCSQALGGHAQTLH